MFEHHSSLATTVLRTLAAAIFPSHVKSEYNLALTSLPAKNDPKLIFPSLFRLSVPKLDKKHSGVRRSSAAKILRN